VTCPEHQRLLDTLQASTVELHGLTQELTSLINTERDLFERCLDQCRSVRVKCDDHRADLDAHVLDHACQQKMRTR
jgi:arginine deiminase